MPKRFDEAELLALIEDGLDEHRAAALRDQLEHDPEMKALVERLRRDRQALRSIPQPQLPHDFAADLEPLVVRSMLTEPPLGEYRRQMARRGRGRRWVPLAAAASVAVVVLGGVWAAVTGVLSSGREGLDHTFAAAQREAPAMGMELEANLADADSELEPAEDPAWPPPGSTIHHRQPQPVSVAELLAAARPADAPVGSAGRTVVADFALVIFNDDPRV
ncbi:MAG: anti-sigma factor family protein, partial [Planctomycetota bacterium]